MFHIQSLAEGFHIMFKLELTLRWRDVATSENNKCEAHVNTIKKEVIQTPQETEKKHLAAFNMFSLKTADKLGVEGMYLKITMPVHDKLTGNNKRKHHLIKKVGEKTNIFLRKTPNMANHSCESTMDIIRHQGFQR